MTKYCACSDRRIVRYMHRKIFLIHRNISFERINLYIINMVTCMPNSNQRGQVFDLTYIVFFFPTLHSRDVSKKGHCQLHITHIIGITALAQQGVGRGLSLVSGITSKSMYFVTLLHSVPSALPYGKATSHGVSGEYPSNCLPQRLYQPTEIFIRTQSQHRLDLYRQPKASDL